MPTELGQLLKSARHSAGLTQRQLAEKLGVANGTVQQWELGIRVPRYETLEKLEQILHIALVPSNLNPPAHDILSEVDIAFYNGFKELTEEQQETIRDMVQLMRERRKDKK